MIFTKYIQSNYSIQELLSIRKISKFTHLIVTNKDKFLLKQTPNAKTYQMVSNRLSNKFPVNELIKTKNNSLGISINKFPFILTKLYKPDSVEKLEYNKETLHKITKVLADYHQIMGDKKSTEWREGVNNDALLIKQRFNHTIKDIPDLPCTLIHSDFGLHNVMKTEDNYLIFDYQDAHIAPKIFDIADLILAFHDEKGENIIKWIDIVVNAYETLSDTEIETLQEVILMKYLNKLIGMNKELDIDLNNLPRYKKKN